MNECKSKQVVGIVGLGLLGGSLAKALTAYTEYTVIGYARREETCKSAIAAGAVAEAFTALKPVVEKADILIFALPPDTNIAACKEIIPYLREGMLVSDVSSTKSRMCSAFYHMLPKGVRFVSMHPMAGGECGGFERADKDLFKGSTWIVLKTDEVACTEEDILLLSLMGNAIGGHVVVLPLEQHDTIMSSISHMPHLVAAMVAKVAGEYPLDSISYELAAGGFRDVTRISGGNPSMWREILRGNATEIDARLTELIEQIIEVRECLKRDDEGKSLECYLRTAKYHHENYVQIKKSIT